jgi:integrase
VRRQDTQGCTHARRAGVALEMIQAALGHADRRSTERYAKAADLAPTRVLAAPVSEQSPASKRPG